MMSHFNVMILGKDIEKQLAPFQENNMDDCPEKYLTFHELSEKEAKEDCIEKDSKTGKYGYWENPNAKWDWFLIGGRWTGYLKLKKNRIGTCGEPGLMTPKAKPGCVDSALLQNIDIEGMKKGSSEDAKKRWEKAHKLIDGLLEGFISWDKMRDVAHKGNIGAARDAYHKQSAVIALRKDKDFGFGHSVNDFLCSREEYEKEAASSALPTFAIIKDGKWFERGKMGWFGQVAEEKEQTSWNEEFNKLMDDLPGETLITIVDCHI